MMKILLKYVHSSVNQVTHEIKRIKNVLNQKIHDEEMDEMMMKK
jgi:hypothetical protein